MYWRACAAPLPHVQSVAWGNGCECLRAGLLASISGWQTAPMQSPHTTQRDARDESSTHEPVSPERFMADILTNRHNRAILDRWHELALPNGWLVAGCLFQTVWNLLSGRPPEQDIKDYDLFYFDAGDLSEAGEQRMQARVEQVLGDLGVMVEASNQARVHTWYPTHFGQPYEALHSVEDGIQRFLVPATCVAVRPREVYAPNGLRLLYEGVLAMNPLVPHQELFERKAASYRRRWPWLRLQ